MQFTNRKILLSLSYVLLVSLATAQVPQFFPFTADMLMSTTRPEMGQPDSTGNIFVGKNHMRLNISAQGHEMAMITDFTTKTIDMLMIEQKMYIEHMPGQAPGRGTNYTQYMHPYDPENPCSNQPDITCKKIGVETVGGRTCDHWEITNRNGKVTNIWVDEKLHFPIKATTSDSSILLSNIKEGEPDASLFQVPSDFHKLDMGGMMPPGAGRPPSN